MLKNLKIFPKILINCLLIACIPLAGLVYQIYLNEDNQKQVVEQRLRQAADVVANEVDNWVDKNLRNSKFVASLEPLKTMNADAQVPLLKAAKENLEWMSLMFVKDLDGNAVARSDGKALRNYSDREYFKEVISGSPVGSQVLIGKLKPVPLNCFAIPVKDDNQTMVGVVTQCSTLVEITEYVASSRFDRTGFVFLVDNQNRLIAYGGGNSRLTGQLQDFSNHPALKLPNGQLARVQYEGEDRVYVSKATSNGWRLVVQQDYQEAYDNYFQSRTNTIWFVIITFLITCFLSFLISYNISLPVKKLTEMANAYSRGIFVDNPIDADRKDELGELAKAVSRMSKTIQMALSRLKKKNK